MEKLRRHRRGKRPEPIAVEGRVPPHDLDAEAAVLSARDARPAGASTRSTSSCARALLLRGAPPHLRGVRRAQRRRASRSTSCRSRTWLRDRERLAQVGGMAYLTEVLNAAPAVANVAAYGADHPREVARAAAHPHLPARDGAGLRRLRRGAAVHRLAPSKPSTTSRARASRAASHTLRDVMQETFQPHRRRRPSAARASPASPPGFDRYDRMTSGLHDGELTIVAARPGMGKTSLVLNMAVNVAQPAAARERATTRTSAGRSRAAASSSSRSRCRASRSSTACSAPRRASTSASVRTGMLTPSDWSKLTQAAAHLGSLTIWVDDSPALSILELRVEGAAPPGRVRPRRPGDGREEAAHRPRRRRLPAAHEGARRTRTRASRRSARSRAGLKQLAKELSLPVIALSQLNRAVETRSEKSKRPQLSDLRESGAIEQDADNICFIYRDDYYNKETAGPERRGAHHRQAAQRPDRHGAGPLRRAVHALRQPRRRASTEDDDGERCGSGASRIC